jgi:UDP-3-O-[3-hydroxymyristoyl] glucosamine N-acyltransferase
LTAQSYRLGELAEQIDCRLDGDASLTIDCVATLEQAKPGALSFLANRRYQKTLGHTHASAVIIPKALTLASFPFALLRTDNPHLAFARAARLLNPPPKPSPGIADSAIVHPSAKIAPDAEIGPGVIIEQDVSVGPRCVIQAGVVLGRRVAVAQDCFIATNASVLAGCEIGARAHIDAGVVIGCEGFGFARAPDHWEAVPQLGRVIIADDVSIGANTTLDRGSIGDTVIERGCKIDNLVQIAHNVHIGAHTVIAAQTGISGSTRIGEYCTIGGQVGIAGHLEIAPGSTFTGMTMVTGHVPEAGIYSSGVPAANNQEWRRNAVRFRQLDAMARRLDALEKRLTALTNQQDE